MDAAYEETFHWHSGKPIDEYKVFISDVLFFTVSLFSSFFSFLSLRFLIFTHTQLQYEEQFSTATFFWHYGRSLEISLKPPETNEFSQHLRVQLQIQAQKFPDIDVKRTKKANSKNSKAKPGSNNAKCAGSAQWKVLVTNSVNMLSKPCSEYDIFY